MNIAIEKMLSHVYEIEGLMLVTRRLGEENTPDVITNKIQRKVRELAEMCGVDLNAPTALMDAEAPSPVPDVVPEPQEPAPKPASEGLPEDDYDADETWQHDNGEEFKEVFTMDYQEPSHNVQDPKLVPVADREPDDDITVEFIEAPDDEPAPEKVTPPAAPTVQPPVFRVPVDTSDEPVPDPDPAFVPEDDRDLPDISVEFIDAQNDVVPEPQEEMPVPPVPTDIPLAEDVPAGPMRVDEKLQRDLSRDIRKAISVNDRFRFQRELFAGSASAMNTAIEQIEMMKSYGNAELYFFSQLHWDRDKEEVKDFMAIVRNHFQR